MKKLPIFIAIIAILAISSAYAIKNDIHKKVFGGDSKLVYFIEETLGHKPPLIDKNIVGQAAPDFSLAQLDGGRMNLADYKGKLVILNFWASWCPPCRAEMPAFVGIQEKYKAQSVQFLGVAIEDKENVDKFLNNEIAINYPTSYGVEEAYEVSARYGNPDGALPYTLVISPEQIVLESFNGQVSEEMLEEVITKHLK